MLLNYQELVQTLSSGNINDITKIVVDLRERIEVLHTSEYNEFLQRLYPVLHSIMTQRTKPQFVENEENKCRHAILDLLYRFPHNEVLKPIVDNFLNMIMPVFADDNEENALTALRIIFDLHKAYRPILESHAQPFLEQVQKILKNMPSAVKIIFSASRPSQISTGQFHNKAATSVHATAQSMPGAIAVPGAPPTAAPAGQYGNPGPGGNNGGGHIPAGSAPDNNSVSNTHFLSSNTYLLGGTAAGAGVVSPMGVHQRGVAESKEDMRIMRAVSAPEAKPPDTANQGQPLLLSQPNFQQHSAQTMQSSGHLSPAGANPAAPHLSRSMSSSPAPHGGDGQISTENQGSHHRQNVVSLTRSIESFRVLAECPLIVMLLFQLYPKYQKYIPSIVPLMMNTLSLSPMMVSSAFRTKHKELLAAQVKTLSLLTYLLRNFENRQFAESSRPSEDAIARNVVALLKHCPADIVSTRKEILVAIRHILNTNDFKRGFYSYADVLLDERFLLGPGRTTNVVLRPMAYSTMADLVNHIKDSLTLTQLTRLVYNFSQNLYDTELPLPVQITCVRVLFNVAERLSHSFKDSSLDLPSGRTLLLHIIRVVINKFGALRRFISRLDAQMFQIPNDGDQAEMGSSCLFTDLLTQFHDVVAQKKNTMKELENLSQPDASPVAVSTTAAPAQPEPTTPAPRTEDPTGLSVYSLLRKTTTEKYKRLGTSSKISRSTACSLFLGHAQSVDPMREIKQLLKTMLPGLKNMLKVLSTNFVTVEMTSQQQQVKVPVPLSDSEEGMLSEFMCWTLECCFALKMRSISAKCEKKSDGSVASKTNGESGGKSSSSDGVASTSVPTDGDIRELLDLMASTFTAVEAHHLRPVLASSLQKIYDYAVENQVFLSVIQQLLSYPHTASVALDTMLSFFLSKIYDLSFQTINTSSSTAYSPSGFVTMNGFALVAPQSGDVLIFGQSCIIPPALPIYPNYSAAPSSSASFMSSAKSSLRHSADESDKLKTFKGQRASTLLRLFKMVLGSVKSFPDNEKTLRPWLKALITTCLKCAHECRISVNYLFVLRYLFMTISGGKFDMSYNEILPLFPLLLNSFNKLLCRTDHLIVQNVLLELCLTIPSRLASLSQHLPVLLHLLARALGTKGELPNLALRTLEFWVEHLNADCLHTAMTSKQGLMKDILTGICSHLKPAPYPYGMLALRVLGKLGGRNRNLSGMHSGQATSRYYDVEYAADLSPACAEGCLYPTVRDRKSAVHLLVRKENRNYSRCGPTSDSNAAAPPVGADDMDVEPSTDAADTGSGSGALYGVGLDNAIFRACELLDRLSTRSTAAECEVPSLLLSSTTVTPVLEPSPPRISERLLEVPVDEGVVMDVVDAGVGENGEDKSKDGNNSTVAHSADVRKLRKIPDFFETLLPPPDVSASVVPNIVSRLHSAAVALLKGKDTVDSITPTMHSLLSQEIAEMNQNAVNTQKRNSMKLITNAAYSILAKVINISAQDFDVTVKMAPRPETRPSSRQSREDISSSTSVESDVFSRIILAVVATFEDPILKDDARSFLIGICTHLAIYLRSCEEKQIGCSSMDIDGIAPGFEEVPDKQLCECIHRAVMAAFEDPRDAMYKAGFWLLNVWITVSCHVRRGALVSPSAWDNVVSAHQFNAELNKVTVPVDTEVSLFPSSLITDLIEKAINNCYSSKWKNRVAALRMISALCSRLPSGWCAGREAELLQSIFDMLKQSGLVLMVSTSLDAASVLKKLCASCHGLPVALPKSGSTTGLEGSVEEAEPSPKEYIESKDINLLQFLVLSTFDASMLVRICAKLYLRQIAGAMNCPLPQLLAPIQSIVRDNILPHFINNLGSLSVEDKTGIMTGVSFLLSLPGFIPIDDMLFTLLNDGMKVLQDIKEKEIAPPDFCVRHTSPIVPPSVGITEWGDKTLNEYFSLKVLCLPSDIPVMVEFRLHLIHLIETFHTHSSQIMLGDEQHIADLRLKCFVLLFNSLVTHWDEVKTTAQTTVNSIISSFKIASGGKSENALPKHIMNECLQPLFGAIQDSRRLSLSTLKSLGVILKIVMHKFYVQFGDKFLSHLKHWLEPEKILQPAIWAPGEEVVVAATMMDLFHVLPWNAAQPAPTVAQPGNVPAVTNSPSVLHSFFEQYVQMTIRLEAVRSKYRHPLMLDSPFLAPMSKFLYKFPNEGIAYFLDPRNIANPGVIRLLLQILKYSSVAAHPFLDKLSSPEAISMLRKQLLAPALPALPIHSAVAASMSGGAGDRQSPMLAVKPEASAAAPPGSMPSGGPGMTGGEPAPKRQRIEGEGTVAQAQGGNATGAPGTASPSSFIYNANFPSAEHPMLVPNPQGTQPTSNPTLTSSGSSNMLSGPPLLSGTTGRPTVQASPTAGGNTAGPTGAPTGSGDQRPGSAPSPVAQGSNIPLSGTASTTTSSSPVSGQKRPLQDANAKPLPAPITPGWSPDACVNGLKLLRHITSIFPKIYESNAELTQTLRLMWKILLQRKLSVADEVVPPNNNNSQSHSSSPEPMIAHPSSRVGFRRHVTVHKTLRLLTRCLLIVFNFNPDNVDILFEMLPILSTQLVFDVSFLTEFLRLELPTRYSVRVRRNIIRRFLDVCRDPKRSIDVKMKGWQLIFIPIFLGAFQNNTGVSPNQIFDAEIVETIMQQVLIFGGVVADTSLQRPPLSGYDGFNAGLQSGDSSGAQKIVINDALRIELLKISTLLIENFGAHLVSCRKDVIKFAWNNLKSDDVTTKHWGYVLICRFMATFETPSKIIFQVYFALLRIHQHEGKDLIRLALDILIPVLPDRLKPDELLKAMRYTKKIAVEEGHSLPQLIHLWHIVIRHADIFYPFRSYFIQLMVQSIARLGLTGTCPLDQRQVSVGIADVILEWEWFRQQKIILTNELGPRKTVLAPATADQPSAESTATTSSVPPGNEVKVEGAVTTSRPSQTPNTNATLEKELDFSLYASLVPVLANFLVRLGLYGAEGKEAAMYRLSSRCLVIFRKMVQLVPMKPVRMTYFDRYFITTVENLKPKHAGSVASGSGSAKSGSAGPATVSDRSLETFLLLLSCGAESLDGPSPLFVNNVVPLKELIVPITSSNDYPKAQKAFRELVVVVMKVYPPSKPVAVLSDCGFYHKLKDSADKFLRKYAGMKVDFFKPAGNPSDKSSTSNAGGGDDNIALQRQALLSNLLCLLRLVDVMCIQTPDWVENHGSAFSKLGQKLVSDHIEIAASNLRSGLVAMAGSLQEHGQSIETSKVQPTPHMALISESMRGYPISASTPAFSGNSQHSGPNILPSPDDATMILMICMNVMCRGVATHHLADQKEVVINLMLLILECSDSIVLLGLVVDYFDKWVGRRLSPLSLKSQFDIVAKLDNLDRLSEVLTQVLISRLVAMSERIAVVTLEHMLPPVSTSAVVPNVGGKSFSSQHAVLPRAIDVFGLMSSHDSLRKICTERAIKVWGPTLYDRFLGVFRADLRLHVNRFWPAILPSVLSKCSDLVGCTGSNALSSVRFEQQHIALAVPADHPYRTFIAAHGQLTGESGATTFYEEMLECIGVLSMTSVDACDVWKSMLQILWADLPLASRGVVANAMCENVAKHQYRQNLYWPSKIYGPTSGGEACGSSCVKITPSITPANVPQSLLRAFLLLEPRPPIPIEFLGAIGAHYGTWNDSCEVLEGIVFSEKPNALVKQSAVRTLLSLYNDVGDQDSTRILSRLFSDRTSTDIALSLDNYGLPQIAQCVIWKGLREHNASKGQDKHVIGDALSSVELEIWETRWVESAKSLSQWDVLYHHADKLQMSHVAIEAAAMRSDWESVKRLRYSPSVVACLEMGIPTFKLFDIMQCVLDNRFAEADRLCALTVQMALFRWQLLPPITAGCNAHKGLLHLFHRVIELRESTGMIMEVTKPHGPDRHELPDLKGMIETWRERLPDPRDGMYMWDTLLLWRIHVFKMIQSAVRNVNDASLLAALHDTPWTVTKLAHSANKRGLPDTCLLTLSKLDSVSAMDIPDCYNKLREQILVCLKSEKQWNAGLNIINSTNLEFFDWMQKSELFRLKAVFQDMLGQVNDSYTTFSQSVQMCLSNGKSWFSWGEFCYKVFLKEKSTENAVSAMVPILKAVECNFDKAKPLLSRVLYLLATEDDILTLGNAFQICLSTLPEWVWIPHIPQLLEATRRRESNFVKPVLCRVAEKYPQAIYNYLAYFATEPNSTSGGDLQSGIDNVGASAGYFRMRSLVANDVLDVISRSHKSYYHKVSSIFNSVVNCLGNSKLETACSILVNTLTAVVDDLTIRWSAGVPPAMHHIISFARLIQLAFALPEQSRYFEVGSVTISAQRKRVSDMENEFKAAFSWAFEYPEDGALQVNYVERLPDCEMFVEAVSTWIRKIEDFISRHCASTSMSNLSPALADLFLETNLISRGTGTDVGDEDLEIPGAYQGCWDYKHEPSVNLHTKLVRFSPSVKMVKLNSGKYCRRLSMIGSDGETYHFAVIQTSDQAISSMINFGSICDWVNNGLRQSAEAYQRDVEFQQLNIIPLARGVCLVRMQGDTFSLSQAMDRSLQSSTTDSDIGISQQLSNTHEALIHSRKMFEELLVAKGGDMAGDFDFVKKEMYHKMTEIMPSDAFRNKIRIHCPSPDLYYGRARSLAGQLGLHSAMSVFLNGSNEFKAEDMLFSCADDSVLITGLYQFSKTGVKNSTPKDVKFRLSQNICSALSPVLVLGSFVSCMGSLLDTISAERASLEPLLCLILLESERMTNGAVDMANVKARTENAFDFVEDIAPQTQDITSLVAGVSIFPAQAPGTNSQSATEEISQHAAPIDVHILELTRQAGELDSVSNKKLSWMPWL